MASRASKVSVASLFASVLKGAASVLVSAFDIGTIQNQFYALASR